MTQQEAYIALREKIKAINQLTYEANELARVHKLVLEERTRSGGLETLDPKYLDGYTFRKDLTEAELAELMQDDQLSYFDPAEIPGSSIWMLWVPSSIC